MSIRAVPSSRLSTSLGNPRWSVVSGGAKAPGSKSGSPASIAGLPKTKAWVIVGPPLSVSVVWRIVAASIAPAPPLPTMLPLTPCASPPEDDASLIRLKELTDSSVPAMSSAILAAPRTLPARIVPWSEIVPPPRLIPPPLPVPFSFASARFPTNVLWLTESVPELDIPPPTGSRLVAGERAIHHEGRSRVEQSPAEVALVA